MRVVLLGLSLLVPLAAVGKPWVPPEDGKPKVRGDVPDLARVMENTSIRLQKCIAETLDVRPPKVAVIWARFSVVKGRVSSLFFPVDEVGSDELKICFKAQIHRTRFRRSAAGEVFWPVRVRDGTSHGVRTHHRELATCYEEQLRKDLTLHGRVELSWAIVDGAVQDVAVVENDTGNDALAACMVRKLSTWTFPQTADTTTTWPFVFRKR